MVPPLTCYGIHLVAHRLSFIDPEEMKAESALADL